jgi:hypothetical protein
MIAEKQHGDGAIKIFLIELSAAHLQNNDFKHSKYSMVVACKPFLGLVGYYR